MSQSFSRFGVGPCPVVGAPCLWPILCSCAIVGEEARCAVSHAVDHYLWYVGGDWDGLRVGLFPVQDYFLRLVCQEGFDPRQDIATDSIVFQG